MNKVILAILGVMAALVVAVGVVVVVLVVTGGDDDGSDGRVENGEQDGDGERATGELRTLGFEPLTLDPHITQDAGSAIYIVEIFGGLLTLDPEMNIQPDLAEEVPTEENGGKVVNADGTVTYRFTIRDGAMFHDRKPVNADVVKYSLERAADPATQSLVAGFFLGDIVGVDEKLNGDADEIEGVQVIDDRTVEITIERDLTSFLFKLTYPTSFVVDQQQVENDPNWTRRPNGTGPYRLEEWRFGERIILEANPRYHLGAPSIQTVRYLLTGGGLSLYENGDIDVTGVPLDDILRVSEPGDPLNEEYRSGERLALDYVGFNTNAPPFDDPDVRRAFAMAIDREQIASAVFQDAVPVATGIIMPGLPAYDPGPKTLPFDPEEARRLLEESEYGGPEGLPPITLAESGTGATSGPGTQAIVEMWRENLGVDVQIEQAETATFFQFVDRGEYQAFILGWIMDYPDEENLLNLHFDSESPNNDTFYSNPEIDAVLREALVEQDPQRRIELYRQAEEMILQDAPWVPLFFDRFHVLIKPYVENYVIPPGIVPRLRYIELAE